MIEADPDLAVAMHEMARVPEGAAQILLARRRREAGQSLIDKLARIVAAAPSASAGESIDKRA